MGYTASYKFAIIAFTLLASMAIISFDIPFLGNAFDGEAEDQADGVYSPNQVETSTQDETVTAELPMSFSFLYLLALSSLIIGLKRRKTI